MGTRANACQHSAFWGLWSRGRAAATCLRWYERALAISEKVLGPDHPNTAMSLNNLAGLLQAEGDFVGEEAGTAR